MADIFISYARDDIDFCQRLFDGLTRRGFDVWMDLHDIQEGMDWWEEICTGIETNHNFCYVVSPKSLISEFCQLEYQYARKLNKRIIPVLWGEFDESEVIRAIRVIELSAFANQTLQGQDLATIARANLEHLGGIQFCDFTDQDNFDISIIALAQAINSDYDHKRQHTKYTNLAVEWESKGRRRSGLLRGKELQDAENWLKKSISLGKQPPSSLQKAYIEAGRKAQKNNQVGIGVFFILAVTILAVFGLIAQKNQNLRKAQQIAGYAEAELSGSNPERAILLAMAALQEFPYALEAHQTLYRMVLPPKVRLVIDDFEEPQIFLAIDSNGDKLVSSDSWDFLYEWDAKTGRRVNQVDLIGIHVNNLSFHPKEARVLSPGGLVVSHQLHPRYRYERYDTDNPWFSIVYQAFYDPSGEKVVVALQKGGIVVLDAKSRETLLTIEDQPFSDYRPIAVGYNHDWIFTPDFGGLMVYDLKDGEEIFSLEGFGGLITSIQNSPQDTYAAAINFDGNVAVWDTRSSDILNLGSTPKHPITAIAFSPDETQIAIGDEQGTVNVYSTTNGQVIYNLDIHQGAVLALAYHPHTGNLITSGEDKTIQFWDVNAPEIILDEKGVVFSKLAFSKDQSQLLAYDGASVWEVDFETGSLTSVMPLREAWFQNKLDYHIRKSWQEWFILDMRPDLATFIERTEIISISGEKYSFWLVDADTGIPEGPVFGGHKEPITVARFSPNGAFIITGSEDNQVKIWDVEEGNNIIALISHTADVNDIAISPDGEQFATASADGTIKVWLSETGLLIETFEVGTEVLAVTYHPSGNYLLSSDSSGTIRQWRTFQDLEELIDYAKACCVFRELTPEERKTFELPK